MDKIIVHGGHRLSGSVRISGSKNSALPILAATLLTKEPCVISRVPDLSDIHYMLTILSELGCEVERASGTVTVRAEKGSLRESQSPRNAAQHFHEPGRGTGARSRSPRR